jgi:hypothetical protein
LIPSTQTKVRNLTERADRSSSVDPLADLEASLLAWCRACMYAHPFMAFGNAMLTGYIMSLLRRNHRRG